MIKNVKNINTVQQLWAGLIFLLPLLGACQKESEINNDCQSITINNSLFLDASGDEFTFEYIGLSGDCLEATIRYSGGCGNITASLVAGAKSESNPTHITLRLLLKDNDPCEASVVDKVSFDLKKIRDLSYNEMTINIIGWPDAVIYKY